MKYSYEVRIDFQKEQDRRYKKAYEYSQMINKILNNYDTNDANGTLEATNMASYKEEIQSELKNLLNVNDFSID
ncbi:MAG: hypothetical protein ACRC5R_01650 [Mycoplasmatales bacterium]